MHDGWPQSASNQTSNAFPEPWIEFRNFGPSDLWQTYLKIVSCFHIFWDQHQSIFARKPHEFDSSLEFCRSSDWSAPMATRLGENKKILHLKFFWKCECNGQHDSLNATHFFLPFFFLVVYSLVSTTTNSNLIGQHSLLLLLLIASANQFWILVA